MSSAILLTGRPGCGKTTLIRRIIDGLDRPAGGFYTREIRQGGRRVGFELVALDGRSAVLAHVEFSPAQRVGRYGLDLSVLDGLGIGTLRAALERGELLVIDEIGPMELRSGRFRQVVQEILASQSPLLATIASRETPFTEQVKRHPRVKLVEVTPANREALVAHILEML